MGKVLNQILHQIVRQSGEPDFAQLLNRVREEKHTPADIE